MSYARRRCWAAPGSCITKFQTGASPGIRCRHNLIYWRNEPYFGLGAGAHGSDGARRSWNVKRPADYIARMERGESVELGQRAIDARTSQGETMMLGLRLLEEGVAQAGFAERYGAALGEVFESQLARGKAMGLLDICPERVRLTSQGVFVSNQAMSFFV